MALRRLQREDYTVGWVCALPIELAAAQKMLDEKDESIYHDTIDTNIYTLGRIGKHNVVIACLPSGQIGVTSAAAVATQMQSAFKAIRFGLMVGIGGGVPSEEADIRLGDVVVSQPHKIHGGVVQYDLGKTTPSGFERTGFLSPPPTILLNGLSNLQAMHHLGESRLLEYITRFNRLAAFTRENAGPDILFKADYNHVGGVTCGACSKEKVVAREPRRENTAVHYGTIASGNQVMRDAAERDRVSTELGGVLCFEMEAAGLMNNFPCLVIRGICDYADSHKNKKWQAYAAGMAAGCAKEVLSMIPPKEVAKARTVEETIQATNRELVSIQRMSTTSGIVINPLAFTKAVLASVTKAVTTLQSCERHAESLFVTHNSTVILHLLCSAIQLNLNQIESIISRDEEKALKERFESYVLTLYDGLLYACRISFSILNQNFENLGMAQMEYMDPIDFKATLQSVFAPPQMRNILDVLRPQSSLAELLCSAFRSEKASETMNIPLVRRLSKRISGDAVSLSKSLSEAHGIQNDAMRRRQTIKSSREPGIAEDTRSISPTIPDHPSEHHEPQLLGLETQASNLLGKTQGIDDLQDQLEMAERAPPPLANGANGDYTNGNVAHPANGLIDVVPLKRGSAGAAELEKVRKAIATHESETHSLRQQINDLQDLLEMAKRAPPALTNGVNGDYTNGNVNPPANGLVNLVSSKKPKRRKAGAAERIQADRYSTAYNPRPMSMDIIDGHVKNLSGSTFSPTIDGLEIELENLLAQEDELNDEVTMGLIRGLKIPALGTTPALTDKEVLFPSWLINLVTSEMWNSGFVKESEGFLANVMQSIQQEVMLHDGEEAVNSGAFWLSNVHEMLSFLFLAEDWYEAQKTDIYELDRLLEIVKNDLESLEFNIYHTWMKVLKKKLQKMIVPAIIESQSVPGFATKESNRFHGKHLPSNNTPAYSMDDLLSLLNNVFKAMKAYYLEDSIISQTMVELLRLVGVTAFNDLLMRRNFLSWKRGVQINYNITRIEELCKSHDIPEAILQLEHLMQATKLLQLKKATQTNIEVIQDICWMLSPNQIQKLLSQYLVADYEQPINSELMKVVDSRVTEKTGVLLLAAVDMEDSGPYEIPEPRVITALETYTPSWLQTPRLKRLAEIISAQAMAQQETQLEDGQQLDVTISDVEPV